MSKLLLILLCTALSATAAFAKTAAELMAAGEQLYARGEMAEAIEKWREAQRRFARARDAAGQVTALLRQGAAAHALGQHRIATIALIEAEVEAEKTKDKALLAEAKAARGTIAIFARAADQAEGLLTEARKLAAGTNDAALKGRIASSLGTLLSAQQKPDEAAAVRKEALAAAKATGDHELAASVHRDLASDAITAKDFETAEREAGLVAKAAGAMPESRASAFLLMGAAQLLEQLFIESPEHRNAWREQAFGLYERARKLGEKIGDPRAVSFALGAQGAMYEQEKRNKEALALTRRAVLMAQQAHSPDALYRWERQTGRLLAKAGDRDAAILAYRRSVATLQGVRNDVAMRYGNRHARSSFRAAVGGTFVELADLLLQRADTLTGEEQQTVLREARDTAELLKAAELEDYFQDDCVNVVKAKTKSLENLSDKAAIVYVIPLPNRTEILVGVPSGKLERLKADVTEDQLTLTVRGFRDALEDRTTEAYFDGGQKLYTWLIKPIEPLLAKHKLDTLVFVPDGALRTVPMAALYDGEKFLVEKYAVAVTPGLQLLESAPASKMQPRVMIAGLSESRDGYPPLPNVPAELAHLQKVFKQENAIVNDKFVHGTVGKAISEEPFTIVHIASHGHFDDDVRKSFVLTYDKHMTLDDLETYIRPAQLREQGIELLTLSACQTAAGDDRAALGLAGVAVKAGARAAFATLWFVNDAASSKLVSDFYSELAQHPDKTKAQALQAAQRQLLAQEQYRHPCYWAPYLIIGNWL